MKKLFLLFVTAMLLSISSIAGATVPDSEFAIGGITLGANETYVRSIYGEPTRITSKNAHYGSDILHYKTLYYGASFEVTLCDGLVDYIKSTAHNGLTTPSGIGVGSKRSDVLAVYGEPQGAKNKGKNSYFYGWQNKSWRGLSFIFQDGVIKEARLYSEEV